MKGFNKAATFASVVLLLFGAAIIPTPTHVFWGEIMDSLCAQVGSHEITSHSLTGARECTLGCVESGAKFVLYNGHRRATFQLDDQRKPRAFAGEEVMVMGTYDSHTNTIHVIDIQPVYIDTLGRVQWRSWLASIAAIRNAIRVVHG